MQHSIKKLQCKNLLKNDIDFKYINYYIWFRIKSNMEVTSTIPKESVPTYKFVPHEVLTSQQEIARREQSLHVATMLGNTFHNKVKIEFETTDGARQVETTIWATTDKNIMLKGGVNIPISCIREIRM